jgi:hypothetical protein
VHTASRSAPVLKISQSLSESSLLPAERDNVKWRLHISGGGFVCPRKVLLLAAGSDESLLHVSLAGSITPVTSRPERAWKAWIALTVFELAATLRDLAIDPYRVERRVL